jgi:hypothetical protein
MPRRTNARANPPVGHHVYDETKPPPPKPITYTDKKGRTWTVDFLKLWTRDDGKEFERGVRAFEATHLGFTYAPISGEMHQRVYRFHPGDNRELTPESSNTALLVSKRVQSHAELVQKKLLERLSRLREPHAQSASRSSKGAGEWDGDERTLDDQSLSVQPCRSFTDAPPHTNIAPLCAPRLETRVPTDRPRIPFTGIRTSPMTAVTNSCRRV